ncbi:MAG: hypothetical protein LBT50_11055 [Prevotellaceae bacterium]|nr:hypothetical protein [Prevotellaceae bacterium]
MPHLYSITNEYVARCTMYQAFSLSQNGTFHATNPVKTLRPLRLNLDDDHRING